MRLLYTWSLLIAWLSINGGVNFFVMADCYGSIPMPTWNEFGLLSVGASIGELVAFVDWSINKVQIDKSSVWQGGEVKEERERIIAGEWSENISIFRKIFVFYVSSVSFKSNVPLISCYIYYLLVNGYVEKNHYLCWNRRKTFYNYQ